MAHWAELDKNNLVIRVVVGDNDDPNGDEGLQWLIHNCGGTWLKTSYNGNIRGVYAGIGYSYNETEDIFVMPQPFPSWTREGSIWKAPTEMPNDDQQYTWNEETLGWDIVELS